MTDCGFCYADAPSQKQAVQVLRTLVNKWMGGTNGATTLVLSNGATFAQFTTEQIVPASFEAVLAPNFDTEDAQAGLQVVNEVASLHVGVLLWESPAASRARVLQPCNHIALAPDCT
jgi:hypothetical protein